MDKEECLRLRVESLCERMSGGVVMVKAGTYSRLKRRYVADYGEEFSGRLAAAVVNALFSEKPGNQRGARFARENAELIAKNTSHLTSDTKLREAVSRAPRVQTNLDLVAEGDKEEMLLPLVKLTELELLIPSGKAPTPHKFLRLARRYYKANVPRERR